MHHIGQQVVCIDAATFPFNVELKVGKTYTVKIVSACNCQTVLGVGVLSHRYADTTCSKCGSKMCYYPTRLFRASRFVTLEEYRESEKAVSELTKELTDLQLR